MARAADPTIANEVMLKNEGTAAPEDGDGDKGIPTSLSLEISGDSQQTHSYNLDLDYSLESRLRLFVGLERSESLSSGEEVDTHAVSVGAGTDPLQFFSFALTLETWGLKDQLTTDALKASLVWASDDWMLSLTPQMRSITLYRSGLLPSKNSRQTITDPSLGAGIKYLGIRHWRFALRGTGYSYSSDMTKIDSSGAAKVLSSSAITLSSGFLRSSVGAEVGRSFEDFSLSLGGDQAVSAVDGSISDTVVLNIGLYLVTNLDFRVQLGLSRTENSNSPDRTLGGLLTTYSFE